MNIIYVHTFLYSRVMAGAIELTEVLSLFKLPWFVFVCICSFGSIFVRAFFIIGLLALKLVRKEIWIELKDILAENATILWEHEGCVVGMCHRFFAFPSNQWRSVPHLVRCTVRVIAQPLIRPCIHDTIHTKLLKYHKHFFGTVQYLWVRFWYTPGHIAPNKVCFSWHLGSVILKGFRQRHPKIIMF